MPRDGENIERFVTRAGARWGWPPQGGAPASLARLVLGGAAALAFVVALFTSYYQVEPDEVAVVQRFGAYVRTTEPGPHLKVPFFIETATKVPVQRQLKMEFGFRTSRAGIQTQFERPTPQTAGEAVMLTGDLNVAVVEWIVQYRIREPRQFLFHVRDVPLTFHYMSEAAMRQVVGDHSVDEVLTVGREEIARLAKVELQRLCDLYGIGIEVQQLVLQDVNPPDPVKPAFNEVNQAIQEKERAINDAWADYNMTVPRAKGEAEQAVRSAEGYALERVNNAEGDAKRFEALYEEYRKAPAVTRKRIYLEVMQQLLPKVGRTIILDDKAKGILPLLQLPDERRPAASDKEGRP
ncbi:MAG TPA: FtsH protease activity modulator HflK [Candidatus Polarisedimenticolia bacterium]